MTITTNIGMASMPEDHWVVSLGIELRIDDPVVTCSTSIRPSMWIPGTERVRLGILSTMVDLAGGHVPDGARTPTVDMRVQFTDTPPASGPITLIAHPKRVGYRLVVATVEIFDGSHQRFAMGTTTFLNKIVGPFDQNAPLREINEVMSFDDLLGVQVVSDDTIEVEAADRIGNGIVGTIQGGAQATVAERAAEHLLGRGHHAADVDIRFLGPLRTGPLRATARVVGRTAGSTNVRVDLVDGGEDEALVSYVSLLMENE